MLFNSLEFLIFLPLVFTLYWILNKELKAQNVLLLVASYVFYGWWDWRFLSLIFLSSCADYLIGMQIEKSSEQKKRKLLLATSFVFNLGALGFFKYYNFFQKEFIEMFANFGVVLNPWSLKIVLPVGISFYTFQTLSYTLDVYHKKIKPSTSPIAFFAFVSFFPQLVAGPIERASNLLPQFYKQRKFDLKLAEDGIRQMLWGFFKKIVIADNCAIVVEQIFGNHESTSSLVLIYGAILFAFQIYGDFSGYSDIAIGCARLFGFDLMRNFAYPYFSRDIAEFWRRWHISLSTWFRDYLYIPLGGSRGNKIRQFRNVLIIFLVSGFWHGANWTFLAWGAINALMFLPLMFLNLNRKNIDVIANDSFFPKIGDLVALLVTFAFTCLAWIFFRADSLTHAFEYIGLIFTPSNFVFELPPEKYNIGLIIALIVFEWFQRKKQHALEISNLKLPIRWGIYYCLVFIIFYFKPSIPTDFIYFQF